MHKESKTKSILISGFHKVKFINEKITLIIKHYMHKESKI